MIRTYSVNDEVEAKNRYFRVCFPLVTRVHNKRNPIRMSPREFEIAIDRVTTEVGSFDIIVDPILTTLLQRMRKSDG